MARKISELKKLAWQDLTKEERVKLLLADSDAYIEKVPEGHWLDVADGIARTSKLGNNEN